MGLALGAIYMHRIAALFITVLMIGCFDGKITPGPKNSTHFQWQKLSSAHLPNAIRLHPKVISGGQPEPARSVPRIAIAGCHNRHQCRWHPTGFRQGGARSQWTDLHPLSPWKTARLGGGGRRLRWKRLLPPKGPQNRGYKRERPQALPICRIGARQKFRDVPLGQQQGPTSASAGARK